MRIVLHVTYHVVTLGQSLVRQLGEVGRGSVDDFLELPTQLGELATLLHDELHGVAQVGGQLAELHTQRIDGWSEEQSPGAEPSDDEAGAETFQKFHMNHFFVSKKHANC